GGGRTAAAGGGAGRLPDRAGGTDQRDQTRGRAARHGVGDPGRAPAAGGGHRRRPPRRGGPRPGRAGRPGRGWPCGRGRGGHGGGRFRPDRDAGTGRLGRRAAGGGPAPRRGLARDGRAARRGARRTPGRGRPRGPRRCRGRPGHRGCPVIRVLLADDQTVVRAGFRALLDLTDDLVVVAEAADGVQAVELARTTRPDVVLMDIRMPRADGLEATRRIGADRTLDAVRVLVLTTYEADEYVFEALRAGAAGFLLKDIDPDDLRTAIRTVSAGRSLL